MKFRNSEVTMITKLYSKQKDINDFKKQFLNGSIETDVIFNIVHDESKIAKHKSLEQYHYLWNSYDLPHSGLAQVLQSILVKHSSPALNYYLGHCDFVSNGNRNYHNYVLAFNGLTFIVSSKPEVVLVKDKNFVNNVVEFDNAYKQLILDYIYANMDDINEAQKEMLVAIESIGIVQDGKINISYR